MNKKLIYALIAAIALTVIIVILSTVGSVRQTPSINLPSPDSQGGSANADSDIGVLGVTKDTVQTVLSKLSKVESFSRSYTVTTYWQGGESEESINYWQKGKNIRMSLSRNGYVKNTLIADDKLYFWYDSVDKINETEIKEESLASTDRYARLISYEELLESGIADIKDAGYIEKLGEPCIFAEYVGSDNYVNRVYISVSSGLLLAYERYEGSKLAVSMEAEYTDLSTPSDDIFAPPA
ncbi:MAG: hypothetical protein GX025_03690 [Clostridiales bacterium]|nr:hypothetical protein [Clostridiales bacterium]